MSDGAVRMRLTGRVQGVGFRYFTLRTARALGVVGRVANLPDGSVEVLAAADPQTLERFRAELRRGPAGARVTGLDEEPLPGPVDWTRFEIGF